MLSIRSFIVIAVFVLLFATAAPATAMVHNGVIGGDVGIIRVMSNPSGADVNLDGRYEGTTTVDIRVYVTATPPRSIIVSKSGYYSKTVSAPLPGPGEVREVYVTLERKEPESGWLDISSSPSGAAVRVDGHYVGTTPVMARADPGRHRIQVEYSGYRSWSYEYQVSAGQTRPVHAVLEPREPEKGYLSVASSPKGADVYVDGQYRGFTPTTVGQLSVGSHTLELRLAGYETYTTTFRIYTGDTTNINANLKSMRPGPTTGSIAVRSYPSGASIYLDGNYKGKTVDNDYFDIIGLAPGRHSLMLRKPGYEDHKVTVTVTGGGATSEIATLNPKPEPQTTGSLNVNSVPSGVEVYVDNLFRGYTPAIVPNLSPGTHTITLKMSGYNDWISTTQVNAGETVPVTATMTPKPMPPPPTPSGGLPVAVIGALALLGTIFVVGRRK